MSMLCWRSLLAKRNSTLRIWVLRSNSPFALNLPLKDIWTGEPARGLSAAEVFWATCAALKPVICFAKALAQTTRLAEQKGWLQSFPNWAFICILKGVLKTVLKSLQTSRSPSVLLVLKHSGERLLFLAPAQQLSVPGESYYISASVCGFWSVRIYLGHWGWHGASPSRADSSFHHTQCTRFAATATVPFKVSCALTVA